MSPHWIAISYDLQTILWRKVSLQHTPMHEAWRSHLHPVAHYTSLLVPGAPCSSSQVCWRRSPFKSLRSSGKS